MQKKILSLWILFLLLGCAGSKPDLNTLKQENKRIAILATHDFAGALLPEQERFFGATLESGGAENLAAYLQAYRNLYQEDIFLLDAGGFLSGSLAANLNQGQSVIELMNFLEYQGSTLGAAEFEFGSLYSGGDSLGVLKKRLRQAKFPILAANIFQKESGDKLSWKNVYPSTIVDFNGVKIGLLGLADVNTSNLINNPVFVSKLEFIDLETALREQAETLRRLGSQVVILLIRKSSGMEKLLEQIPEGLLDVVIAGQGENIIHEKIGNVSVLQAPGKAQYISRVELFVNKKTKLVDHDLTILHKPTVVCKEWFKNSEDCDAKVAYKMIQEEEVTSDQFFPLRKPVIANKEIMEVKAVKKLIAPYIKKAQQFRRKTIAIAAKAITYNKHQDSALGALFTKAISKKFPEKKVILLNGSGFRKSLKKGKITYGDLMEAYPFNNVLAVAKLRGAELKEVLRIATSGAIAVPAIKGLKVKYKKANLQGDAEDFNNDGVIEAWEKNRLLDIRWENGKPIMDTEEIEVLTTNMLVNGGDYQENTFGRLPKSQIRVLYGQQIRHIVSDYLRKQRRALNSNNNPLIRKEDQRIFPIP